MRVQGRDECVEQVRGQHRFLANPDFSALVVPQLTQLSSRWRTGELDAALFTALYFLCWQIARHGRSWAARKSRHDAKPQHRDCLMAFESLAPGALRMMCLDVLQRYTFRGVRPEAPAALCQWLKGIWRLTLCTDVPLPRAVLAMQAQGTRPVTVITEFPAMFAPVHDKADAFHFLLHDLEHAHRFFEDNNSHLAQCRLAEVLMAELNSSRFDTYLSDPLFRAKFDYLIADMNTHVAHALHYLRAILIEFHLRQAGAAPDAMLSPAAASYIAIHVRTLAQAVGLSVESFERLPHFAPAVPSGRGES